MAAQNIVRSGVRWRLGNGQKIRIWSDKWLPIPSTFKVISPPTVLGSQALVFDLIYSDTAKWKYDLVHQIFVPHEADIILGLPLSSTLPADTLIWSTTPNGKFSVRSAYKIAMETRLQSDFGSCSNNSDMKTLWKVLWSLKIPNKVKHFGWRACKNILPTLSNLKKRGIVDNDLCEECKMGYESFGHVFWSYLCASGTWALTSIFCRQQHLFFNDFMELFWFLVHVQKSGEEVLSLAVTIAWALWTRQNEKRNGKQFMTGFELVKWCGTYIESFKVANSSTSPSSGHSSNAVSNSANAVSANATSLYAATSAISGSTALGSAKQCRQVWSPPDASIFKVNVVGVVFAEQRKSGVGVVIRNSEGLFMGALSIKLNQHLGSLEVEAKAYELGITFANDMGFHEIDLEGDSFLVSNAIAGISPPPSSIASVVYGISSLLSAFRRFSISHVGRKGNQVAHLLAKHAQGVEQYVAWIEESPCFLEHALSTNVLVSSLC